VAKACSDAYMDAMLDLIATADTMTVCSGQPANVAGISAVALADATLTPGDGNGDFTVGNGDTNGRKLTVAAQSNVDIDTSGTATHVVIDDGTNLYITTCSSQALTSGGTVTVPAVDIEVADPS
jgi:hypothetical protein